MKAQAHYKFSDIEAIREILYRQHNTARTAFVTRWVMAHNGEQPSEQIIGMHVWDLPEAIRRANVRHQKFYGMRNKYQPHQGKAECARRSS